MLKIIYSSVIINLLPAIISKKRHGSYFKIKKNKLIKTSNRNHNISTDFDTGRNI